MGHLMSVNVKDMNDDDAQIVYMCLAPSSGAKLKYRGLNELTEKPSFFSFSFFKFIYLFFQIVFICVYLTKSVYVNLQACCKHLSTLCIEYEYKYGQWVEAALLIMNDK